MKSVLFEKAQNDYFEKNKDLISEALEEVDARQQIQQIDLNFDQTLKSKLGQIFLQQQEEKQNISTDLEGEPADNTIIMAVNTPIMSQNEIQTQGLFSTEIVQQVYDSGESTNQNSESAYKEEMRKRILKLLKGKRNRGAKDQLQKGVNSYWTNNFLPFGKRCHFKFLLNELGKQNFDQLLQALPQLKEIKEKIGMSLVDFQQLYKIPQLDYYWEKLFASKYLYSQLMVSRVKENYRKVFARWMFRFQQAFITKHFIGISRQV